jgi:hypothetical protein
MIRYHYQVGGLWVALGSLRHSQVYEPLIHLSPVFTFFFNLIRNLLVVFDALWLCIHHFIRVKRP